MLLSFFKDSYLSEVIAEIFMNGIQCQLCLKIVRKRECVGDSTWGFIIVSYFCVCVRVSITKSGQYR